MRHLSSNPFASLSCVLISLCLISGCGSGVDPDQMLADATDNNVKRLSRMYTVFQMRNSMVGPKDEVEFKEFIASHSSVRLARIGIDLDNIDQIFSSERDGKKLIVRYGTTLEGSDRSIPVVFEAKGLGGGRLVGFSNAYSIEVNDADRYDKLMAGEEDNKVIDSDDA